MASLRLGPTSYVVLGMVALRGPSTPYEVKRAVRRSVGRFWPFPHAQMYAEPQRLARAGLLTERREEEGRRRRIYTITEAGLDALRAWLREPTTGPMEIRDLGELKLFFSELATEEDIVALARTQALFYHEQVAELEVLQARFADDATRARRMAPLRLGMGIYRAAAAFWDEIAADVPATRA
jgi:PadR family transcriptional regulator, regulatory protein AphA